MEKSTNYNFNLPNSANDEIADINDISDNFRIIDEKLKIDQTFLGTSENPQSGKAIASEIGKKQDYFADISDDSQNRDINLTDKNGTVVGQIVVVPTEGIRYTNVLTPENETEGANKKYVDENSGAGKKLGTSEVFNDYTGNKTYKYEGVRVTNITNTPDNSTFTLESVAGLAVGGTFNIAYRSDSSSRIMLYSTQLTIASVDATNKTITMTAVYSGPPISIYLLYVVNSTATDATPLYVAYAHAEGQNTKAIGTNSHAEGQNTKAIGTNSHAQNFNTTAGYDNQTAMGVNNINKSDTLLEVGNGSVLTASNAFEVYTDGHAEVQTMGTTDNSIALKKYVDDIKTELLNAITHPYTYDETTKELTLIL